MSRQWTTGATISSSKACSAFNIVRELDVTTTFRQAEAELWEEDEAGDALSIAERASLEIESRRFADAQGYAVDWKAVGQLDDYSLVNAIAQIAPFDYAAKQALLEARGLSARADLIVQLMQFFGTARRIGRPRYAPVKLARKPSITNCAASAPKQHP